MDPGPSDPATEIIGAMTPAQKLEAAMRLYWSARALKAAWFRQQHPEWSDQEVDRAVRDWLLFRRG